MRPFSKLILANGLIASVVLCLTACSGSDDKNAAPAALEIAVAAVKKSDLPLNYEFVGQTKGAIDAPVRARVEGVLLGIHFEEGKEVTEGQLLYTIDPAEYEAKLAEAKGKLAEAETKHARAQSDLKRISALAKINAVSQRDLETATAQEGATKGAVEAAKTVLDAANLEVSYTKITAPTSGVIGLSKAKVGEFVGKDPNPIVLNTVSKLDPIHARFSVTEKEYLHFARLKQAEIASGEQEKKRELTLILGDGSPHIHTGAVVSIDRQIDAQTGTLAIEAAFPNPEKLVRPGQFARVKTSGDMVAGALLIPKRAIREIQGQYQVFVVKGDNTIESRNIVPGVESNNLQVVTEGLKENEVVALEGLQKLRTGTLVNPKQANT